METTAYKTLSEARTAAKREASANQADRHVIATPNGYEVDTRAPLISRGWWHVYPDGLVIQRG